jgi:hypothetical protein
VSFATCSEAETVDAGTGVSFHDPPTVPVTFTRATTMNRSAWTAPVLAAASIWRRSAPARVRDESGPGWAS